MKSFLALIITTTILILFTSSGCEKDVPDPMPSSGVDTTTVVMPPDLNPAITFSSGPHYTGCAISASGSGYEGVTYAWDVSNGATYTGAIQNLIFNVPGTYTFTLTVTLDGRSEEKMRSVTVVEQPTFTEFSQRNNGYTLGHKILPHPNGGFVSFGDYCRTTTSTGSCILTGFQLNWHDADGTIRSSRNFSHQSLSFRARAITVASDGNVLVTYERSSPNGDDPVHLCLMKTGETGDLVWNSSRVSTDDYAPRAILETSDGRIVVGGYTKQSNNMAQAGMYWFEADGTIAEEKLFGALNRYARIERLVEITPNEVLGLMVHDRKIQIANSSNLSMANLGYSDYIVGDLVKLDNGELLVVVSDYDIHVLRTSKAGTIIEDNDIVGPGIIINDVQALDNGNFLLGGYDADNGRTAYLSEVTRSAEVVWDNKLRQYCTIRGIALTDDCGIIATGYEDPPGNDRSAFQFYLVKTKANGEL